MDPEKFLELLNGDVNPVTWKAALASRNGHSPTLCSTKNLPEAQRIFRDYVLRWVKSGIDVDGREIPANRHYLTNDLTEVIQRVAPIISGFDALGSSSNLPDEFLIIADRPSQNNRRVKGVMSIRLKPKGGIEFEPHIYGDQFSPTELAAFAFFLFWGDPFLVERVMMCASCDVFHLPSILRGGQDGYDGKWHCRECQKSVQGAAYRKRARELDKNEALRIAAEAYLQLKMKGTRERKVADLKIEIAAHVAKKMKGRWRAEMQTPKKNWVSRNLAEIEKLATAFTT